MNHSYTPTRPDRSQPEIRFITRHLTATSFLQLVDNSCIVKLVWRSILCCRQNGAPKESENLLEAAISKAEIPIESSLFGKKFVSLVQHHGVVVFGIFSKEALRYLWVVIPRTDTPLYCAQRSQPQQH